MTTFAVHRKEPLLVGPAAPTPCETKRLSDTDDQEVLRTHVPFVFFYRGGKGGVRSDDRRGRVADADVRLAELEAADGLRPPFPCMDQLLFDVEGSSGVLNCPLLLIQVTRLLCGGFVFAFRLNHTICDAAGLAQFLSAVVEHARGLPSAPTVAPAWSRHLLEARRHPKPTFSHPEYEDDDDLPVPLSGDMVMRTFIFSSDDVNTIKNRLPPHLRNATTSFEALTAALWCTRTAALGLPPDDEVKLAIVVNFRRLPELALPAGYYGNAYMQTVSVTTAGSLVAGGSLGDAVEMVRKAKASVTAEYVLSRLGQPSVVHANTFVVTDHRHAGFHRVDFGWGEPVYGGIAEGAFFGVSSLVAIKNGDGEDAVGVLMVLPQPAMDRFASEIQMLLKG
ncbi:hypothetical protein EJB05_23080, partial [Eragrostis curvula]